jgi:aminoglycoside phosphotransferase (APT) family kinase protein
MAEDGLVRAALVRELAAWLGRAPASLSIQRLGGGESSDCYRFDLDQPPSTLVLRLMRDDGAAAREQAFQQAVAAQGFPASQILRVGSSASAFGRPFSIMTFVAGHDPVTTGLARQLPRILAQTMADLHALPIEAIRTSLATGGRDLAAIDIGALIAELRQSTLPEIARAARSFDQQGFGRDRFVVCHGDLHARNLLMEGGRVVAVIDWEIAVLAPREYDVARSELLLRLMPGVGAAPLRPLVRLLGRRLARQFLAAYATRNVLDAALLDRCRALHALRLLQLVRAPGLATDSVRALWRPFARELAQSWTTLTGEEV